MTVSKERLAGRSDKVWPSVEGEIVREEWARPYPDDQWSINVAGVGWLRVSGPGQWRVIVQKVGE